MSIHLAPSPHPALVAADRPLATWNTRHPGRSAAAVGLGGVLLTAFGMGVVDAVGPDGAPALLVPAAFVGLSALVGLLVMWRSRPSLADYGFRRPMGLARIFWGLPLVAVVAVVFATSDIRVVPGTLLAATLLAVAIGFNEEIWFRGLLLASLRTLGSRRSVVAASVIFGALHLANLFTGQPLPALLLQFAFAALVGLVLAEIVALTGSLWIGIVWHVIYDAIALHVVDDFTAGGIVGLAVVTVLLAGYAAVLWRALPMDGQPSRLAG